MKDCPHCGGAIANLAATCPHCRSAVSTEEVAQRSATLERAANADATPDPVGYFVVGAFALVGGVLTAAAGDGGWDTVGVLMALIGGLTILTGAVAVGVYVGMRRFHEWQKTGRE